jgi:hypothetical protein
MEDLLGFRKQGGRRTNIQIFVLFKCVDNDAVSKWCEIANHLIPCLAPSPADTAQSRRRSLQVSMAANPGDHINPATCPSLHPCDLI